MVAYEPELFCIHACAGGRERLLGCVFVQYGSLWTGQTRERLLGCVFEWVTVDRTDTGEVARLYV